METINQINAGNDIETTNIPETKQTVEQAAKEVAVNVLEQLVDTLKENKVSVPNYRETKVLNEESMVDYIVRFTDYSDMKTKFIGNNKTIVSDPLNAAGFANFAAAEEEMNSFKNHPDVKDPAVVFRTIKIFINELGHDDY